jgi:hypothetical protein
MEQTWVLPSGQQIHFARVKFQPAFRLPGGNLISKGKHTRVIYVKGFLSHYLGVEVPSPPEPAE